MSKYYSVEEAVKMLPYIKSYCKDIQNCHLRLEKLFIEGRKLSKMTSASKSGKSKIEYRKNSIFEKTELCSEQFTRWREELKALFISICNTRLGRVDIPVYCEALGAVSMLCVHPDTTEEDVEWHIQGETYEEARPYFEKVH